MWKRLLPLAVITIVSILMTTGCSTHLTQIFKKSAAVSNLPPDSLFLDGSAIQKETLALLDSAQKSIYVEQFVFDDPILLDVIIRKARAGLEVKILLDQWQRTNKATLDTLKNQNVSVQFFPARKGQYDHVKLLVVDQSKAMIYGPAWTSSSWQQTTRDLSVELSGRSAWWTASVFARDWEFTTTLSLNVPKTSTLSDDHITLATNANIKQQISERILQSNKAIWVESAEVSEQETIQALIDAAAKGRDVRLILDPEVAKATPVIGERIEKLKAGGVKIRYFKSSDKQSFNMHVAIFDKQSFILTSSDWSYYTFVNNHEFSITVPSLTATTKLISVFNQDWANSIPA
ncbi:MAG: phospholipase D-like domain-containing protein [Desulfitobacteriaceae bacterium]